MSSVLRLLLLTGLVCCLLPALPALAKDVVKIDRLAGDVEVQHEDDTGGRWEAAEKGQKLRAGWKLRTGKESKVLLLFPKDNTVILRENSYLFIKELAKGGGARLESNAGGLLVDLKHKLDRGSEFTLETPSAQAIVRGTKYGAQIVETGEKGDDGQAVTTTEFYGYEGEVEVRNDKGSQTLLADMTINAVLGQAPGLPIQSVLEAIEFLEDLDSDDLFRIAEERLEDEIEKQKSKLRDELPKIPGGFKSPF